MRRILAPVLFTLLITLGARAGQEVMEIDPLAEKDLFHFKQEGEDAAWRIDDKSDDIFTLMVHDKAASDTSILFTKRTFKQGFRLSMEVQGGSKNKGLSFFLVPPEGDRIEVPFSPRWLAKSIWHEFVVTVEKGEAYVKVDDDAGDKIQVQDGVPYTFAIKLDKRSEAAFRKMKILFLVVSEEQAKPEEGFVRIFDGKTDEGWIKRPENNEVTFTVGDQKIEGKNDLEPMQYVHLIYPDAVFVDYVLRFKASADTRGLRLIASGSELIGIDDYFARDRDWNEVEWATENRKITLKINGNVAYTHQQEQPIRVAPQFSLYPAGRCILRDIRVKGTNIQPGPSWTRYAAESGAAVGIGGGDGRSGGAFGGRGNAQPGGAAEGGTGPATRTLFDGKSIADWNARPAGVWEVVDEKVVGLTLEKETPAEIIYGKLVFTDYRLTFKVQRGTIGAKFVARAVPKQVADKPPALVDIKPEWLAADQEWNDFEVDVYDGVIKIKANGKEVFRGTVPKDQGFLGFVIGPNSAIGLKTIVWHRPM